MSAENKLRCNNLTCRRYVAADGKAVVTTCSHVFCIACANDLFGQEQVCPACDQVLSEQDDIVSVLAGLTPSVILEIASRAMGFWTYQTSQESSFQSILLKNSKDQVNKLEQELNYVRGELSNTQRKNRELEEQLYNISGTNQNAIQESRDKDREMSKLRGNFDKIKRRTLLSHEMQPLSAVPMNLRPPIPPSHPGTPSRSHPQPFVPTPNRYTPYPGATPVSKIQAAQQRRFQGLRAGQGRTGKLSLPELRKS